MLAFARALAVWTIDGVPTMSDAEVRTLTALRALQSMNYLPLGRQLASLRQLLDHARAFGDNELVTALTACVRSRRIETSGAVDPASGRAEDKLLNWAAQIVRSPQTEW
jgi:hypothetical protein